MLYRPTSHNAIDESMIRFKVRSSAKQYMPKKTIKLGIKVWVRADSANGYFCDFQSPEKGLGGTGVKRLTTGLEGNTIRCFATILFLELTYSELLDNGIYACGTLRANRLHFPDDLKLLTKKGQQIRDKELQCKIHLFAAFAQLHLQRPVRLLTAWSLACCLAKVRIPDCLPDKLESPHFFSSLQLIYGWSRQRKSTSAILKCSYQITQDVQVHFSVHL